MAETEASTESIATDDKNVAMLTHLSGLMFGFLGGLIIWLVHKDKPDKAFINQQAKEALNFQLTVMLACMAAFIASFVLIGLFLFPVIFIANIVFCILAAVAVSNGKNYRYPIALRLVK